MDRPQLRLVTSGDPKASPGARGGAGGSTAVPDEREAWAVLLSVHGLGPAGFGALLAAYGSGRAILAAASLRGAAPRFARIAADGDGRPAFREPVGDGIVAAAAALDDRLAVLRASLLRIVTLDDAAYPPRLRAIDLPPPVLLVRGEPATLSSAHAIAIVGTRRPTERGRLIAARIAGALAKAGAVVVSGLAVGIDGAAHAAVEAEGRPTVAVLGSGHGRLYPRAHQRLATGIVGAGGAVVSELWPDQPPSAHTFPQRNRVISGLADATIVVEAGLKSGALITAKWALEQGRDLFLVPGPIDETRSAGCLHWLREFPGEARIVATVPELIADLGLLDQADEPASVGHGPGDDGTGPSDPPHRPPRPGLDAVLVELGPTARDVGAALVAGHGSLDELVAVTELEPATVLGAITLLELRGLATTTYGRYRAAGQLASATAPEVRSGSSGRLPVRRGPC
ncbi:MAG TPA: DNA-processing protein DprA [Candidatus Limnocylindrales bacterium]|nr:DNA-processing protein DprA [Candidatus Limnocylindrales bacterium]